MFQRRAIYISLTLFTVFVFAACGGSASSSPTEVAGKFLNAMSRKDFTEAKIHATKKSGRMLDNLARTAGMFGGASDEDEGEVKVIREKIDGEKAIVYFEKGEGEEEFVNMMKEDGEWKVNFSKNEVVGRGREKVAENLPDLKEDLGKAFGGVKGGLDSALNTLGEGMDSAMKQFQGALEKAMEK